MSSRSALITADGVHGLTADAQQLLTADRAVYYEVEPQGGNVVALKHPATGRYLSALDEATCAARGVPRYSAMFVGEAVNAWELWTVTAHGRGIALQSCWGTWLSPQQFGGGAVLVDGPSPTAWEELIPSDISAFGLDSGGNVPSGGGSGPDSLTGRVAVIGHSFGDETGPRIVHGCSDFGALAKFHENRDQMLAQLDRVAAAGMQYVRVLWRLNGWLWAESGITNDPIRDPWWEDALRGYLTECWARGLRVNLTSGDFFNWTNAQAEDAFRRVGQIAASVSPDVVWLHAAANELRGIHPDGESDSAIAQCEALQDIFAREYPNALRSISDPESQDEAGMRRLSGGNSNVALIHDVRWAATDALRRCFNTRYENDPGKPVVQDEPTGPNGTPPDGTPFAGQVYQPIEDPAELLAIYTMHVITGQASTYFNDPALVSRQPLDSTWGFKELWALWERMSIPAAIGQGTLKPGHHDDAPLQVIDSNAERADSMVLGDYAIGVISGGNGWRVRSGWDGMLTLFGPDGPTLETPISRGQDIPASGPAPTIVRIER